MHICSHKCGKQQNWAESLHNTTSPWASVSSTLAHLYSKLQDKEWGLAAADKSTSCDIPQAFFHN